MPASAMDSEHPSPEPPGSARLSADGDRGVQTPVDADKTRALTLSRPRRPLVESATVDTVATQDPWTTTSGARRSGQRIDRFVVQRELGAGGMGVVYQAHDPELDRAVAIKLIRAAGDGPDAHLRLLREAQALARLSHPNVVAVHDVGVHGSDVYIVMEFVPAVTLGEWVHAQRRGWREIVQTFRGAGLGLAAAHEADIVHRDFKPANVLVRRDDGRAQVLDFGLARAPVDEPARADDERPGDPEPRSALALSLTRTGAIMGTPAYMSPEQCLGKRAVDDRSDQFSFCVALWEALYGERPFAGKTLRELTATITSGQLRAPPSTARAPRWIQPVLRRGLAVEPDQRWPSMHDLLRALDRDPATVARRWGAAALLLTGGLALGSFGLAGRAAPPDPCLEVADEIDTVWSEQRATRLQTAFDATALPFAEAMGARVRARVTAYAETWREAQAAACRRADDPLYAERNTCLARRRVQLDQTLELLAGVDEDALTIVEHADDIVARLPDVALCDNLELLRGGGVVPASVEEHERVEQARPHLLRADFFLKAYLPDQAAAEIAAVEQLELAYGPVVADLMYLKANLAFRTGEFDEAAEALDRTAAKALEVGHDTLLVDAWLLQAERITRAGTRPRDAHRWLNMAEGALARFGLLEDDRMIRVLDLRGVAYQNDTELDHALEWLERARELAEERWARDDPRLGWIVLGIAHARAQRGDKVESVEAVYREAQSLFTSAFGTQHPSLSDVHHGLAILLIESGERIDDASRELMLAESIKANMGATTDPSSVLLATTRTKIELVQGDLDAAQIAARRAVSHCPDQTRVSHVCGEAWSALGTIDYSLGDFVAARSAFTNAIEVGRRSHGDNSLLVAINMGNLGETLLALGETERAAKHLERAVSLLREHNDFDPQFLAVSLKGLGKAYLSQDSPQRAVPALEEAIKLLGNGALPNELADARWALARAIADMSGGQRTQRAIVEATAAREMYRSIGVDFDSVADEINAWLKP